MQTAIPFDTHAYVKRLQAAGFTESQAETQAQVLAEVVMGQLAAKQDWKELEAATQRDLKATEAATQRSLKELEAATQRYLKELELSFRREIETLRVELKRDLRELELRITVRLGALITAGVGAIAILDKLLK